jgi:hypothetical protein
MAGLLQTGREKKGSSPAVSSSFVSRPREQGGERRGNVRDGCTGWAGDIGVHKLLEVHVELFPRDLVALSPSRVSAGWEGTGIVLHGHARARGRSWRRGRDGLSLELRLPCCERGGLGGVGGVAGVLGRGKRGPDARGVLWRGGEVEGGVGRGKERGDASSVTGFRDSKRLLTRIDHSLTFAVSCPSILPLPSSNDDDRCCTTPAMSEAHKFTSLPTRVLERIALYALESTPSHTFTFLSSLGSAVSEAATRHLFSTMSLENDDAILVEAEEQDPTSACRTMWCSVFRDPKLGELVRELIVTNAGEVCMVGRGRSELVFEEDGEGDEGTAVTPLDSQSFGALLKRLPNLTKFSWTATRSPPAELCAYLGSSARTLVSFSLDLPPPSPSDDKSHAAPKSTERWDATDISRLPLSLRSLSVSHVSLEGSRALASAFSSLPNLESLVISESMFVDDAFMKSLGDAKRLKKLRISSMHGTKLTEKGLGELFEGCTGLEELTLDNVEGEYATHVQVQASSSSALSQGDYPNRPGRRSPLFLILSIRSVLLTANKDRTKLGRRIISIPSFTQSRLPRSPPLRFRGPSPLAP